MNITLPLFIFINILAVLPTIFGSEAGYNLIKQAIGSAINIFLYTQPKNAFEFKPKSNSSYDFGTYDFIIIGAGSAGAVLAGRLSEIKEWKVLLLEAGDFGNEVTDVPQNTFSLQYTPYNWGYYSTPQNFSCLGMKNRRCFYPRGRGIGGSSLINAMIYARPTWEDFQLWESKGNPGWSYKHVFPYFYKLEHLSRDRIFDNPIVKSAHGYHGPVNIEFQSPHIPIVRTILEANQELGTNFADYNFGNGLGVSAAQLSTLNGSRIDTGKVYVRPFLFRKNLKVITGAYVTKILINSKNVPEGVEFSYKGKKHVARASMEVILSAGSINSPVILMHSGIGPKRHLEEMKIKVKQNLEVGSNLQDHPSFIGFNFALQQFEFDILKEAEIYVKNGTGAFANVAFDLSISFLASKQRKTADIEIASVIMYNKAIRLFEKMSNFDADIFEDMFGNLDSRSVLIFFVTFSNAKSKGTVRLKSNNPFDYPLINPNILSNPEDVEVLYKVIQYLQKLSKTKAFRKAGVEVFVNPLRPCKDYEFGSKDYWICHIRQTTVHMYHPVGSCPMGPAQDPEAVVDHNCKVHGMKKLRVIDASVIPFNLGGHPNSVAMMLGEKMADEIKMEYGKKIKTSIDPLLIYLFFFLLAANCLLKNNYILC